MWYSINFTKLATTLIPTCLRDSFLVAIIKVLVSPIAYLHDIWVAWYTISWRKLSVTAQVDILEKYLNDTYATKEGQIYLESPDVQKTPGLYFEESIGSNAKTVLYMESESQTPYYVGNEYYVPSGYNITVHVASTLKSKGGKILEAIRTFKPAGRTLNPGITYFTESAGDVSGDIQS